MAVDELLLDEAQRQDRCTLRFYQWSEPTLSLGYFQSWQERHQHPASLSCAAVRRPSGGGAIMHHHELTYSFATPAASRFSDNEQLYRLFHTSLAAVLQERGLPARLCEPTEVRAGAFLCFQRRATGDLLVEQYKVTGSAQRRRGTALLQHGSVLLRRSPFAPELPGIDELLGHTLPMEEIMEQWEHHLSAMLSVHFQPVQLSPAEQQRVEQIVQQKHARTSWLRRR